jgi:hypothetical protein
MVSPHRNSTGVSSHSGALVRKTTATAEPSLRAMRSLTLVLFLLYTPKFGQG